jgi:hypothetical protein
MHRALLAAAAMLPWAAPTTAHAYDLQTTSTGRALRWPSGEVLVEPAMSAGPPELTDGEVVGALQIAVSSWQAALYGAEVSIALGAAPSGAMAMGDGVNSVRWALDAGDPGVDVGLLAKTHLAYQVEDGAILEADIVVNAADFVWTTSLTPGGCSDDYDLEGSISHELGHLLGLGHSLDPEATMFATGGPCETLKRDLTGDDASAIEFLYHELPPPGGVAPSPTTCAAAGGSGSPAALAVLAAMLGLAGRRSRGRARRAGALLIALCAAVLGSEATAGQLRRLDVGELGARADLVVRGVVVHVETAGVEPHGELATDSMVAVTECLSGDCPETVRVRRRGGERDGFGLRVEGEAELVPGQEVVLFLRARPDRPAMVLGGVQGALRLVRQRGTLFAARDLRGHRVLDAGSWRSGGIELIDLAMLRGSLSRRAF